MLADERKELEEILERQERRSSSSMEVLTKRMFFQFDATHRYIVQRANGITSYLSIVSQGQNKLMMSNFKDVLSKVFVTYERMKSTYLEKSKEQTTTLSYRIKDNLILMRSEMNSIFNYMSSAIEGTRRSLRTELTSEIVSGNKGTVAYMSTAWHGLRNNLNTLGIVNKKYHQSSIERMKIDVKILQSKLNAQTGDVGAMIRENRRLMEYLFEDQSRVNYKHHADQSTFIDAGIQTIFRSIENSAADVKSEAKKDAKEAKDEVLEKIEERTYFLKKELMASRTQVGQKIIGLNEDLTKVITDHRTAIEQKVTSLTTLVTNEVANIKTKIGDESTNIQAETTKIQTTQGEHEVYINATKKAVVDAEATVTQHILSVTARVEIIADNVTEIKNITEDRTAEILTKMGELDTLVKAESTDIQAETTKILTAQTAHKMVSDGLTTAASNLSTTLVTHKTVIDAINAVTSTLGTTLGGHKTVIDTINTNTASLVSYTTDVTAVKNLITNHDTNITEKVAALSKLVTDKTAELSTDVQDVSLIAPSKCDDVRADKDVTIQVDARIYFDPHVLGGRSVRCYPEISHKGDVPAVFDGPFMLIQRNVNIGTWDKDLSDYEQTFGDLMSDYWFGLEDLHTVTSKEKYSLLIIAIESSPMANKMHALSFGEFKVGAKSTGWVLTLAERNYDMKSDHPGGEMFIESSHGEKFYARDTKTAGNSKCLDPNMGGWWMKENTAECSNTNLNGVISFSSGSEAYKETRMYIKTNPAT
uniref:uncharacterized protein LOC120330418 n=1 Tax=Styela clava TaxID=7725 RepID=UPI001939DF92|nr:uncharacterized protein LOC120330418 [Styela clava]